MTVTIFRAGAAASSGGPVTIASGNLATGSPSVIDITSIPQTYSGLKLTIRNASNSVATRALRVTADTGLGLGNAGNDAQIKNWLGDTTTTDETLDQRMWLDATQTAAQKSNVVLDFPSYSSTAGYQTYSGWFNAGEAVDDTFAINTQNHFQGILATGLVYRVGGIVGIRITWDNVATGVFDGGTYLLEGFS
jgi:hypothetical protein